MSPDPMAREVFDNLVKITVGNGQKVLFWRDRWIFGFSPRDIAPLIVAMVSTRRINTRTVAQGIMSGALAEDILGPLSFTAHLQLIHL